MNKFEFECSFFLVLETSNFLLDIWKQSNENICTAVPKIILTALPEQTEMAW